MTERKGSTESKDNRNIEAESGNEFHFVVPADDLNDGERVLVDIKEQEIAVFNLHGDYHAVANYCVHQGGPVCEGMLAGTLEETTDRELRYVQDEEILACPWHGWEFDIESGESLVDPQFGLISYDTELRDGDVYVKV